jgi:hypothetical protein
MPRKGQTMLYRPVPRDFPQTFIRVGWGRIEKEYRAHAKTIKRWLVICGYDALRQARAEYVRENGLHRAKYGD